MPSSNRKQQLGDFQKRMNQSTSSLGNVNAVKTPTKFRSSFSSITTRGASAIKAALMAPQSPTASVSESSLEEDARSDAPSTRRQSVKDLGKLLDNVEASNKEALNKAARRMSAPALVAKKETASKSKTPSSTSSKEDSKTKKQRRATMTSASADVVKAVSKAGSRMGRRASCPAVETSPVELTEFVQLDKSKRRETLATLDPSQVEHLFVESSRKLLAKKTSLQKQLDDLQNQHAAETRRLQEQLVDANMRLKQRELVHAQRQANHQSSLQKEHQRLHKEMVEAQTSFQKQASELEVRSLTLMEQVAAMKTKIEQVEAYEDAADEANYFSFQVMLLLALGVAAVWAPACVCNTGAAQSLTNAMWTYGA